MGEVSFSWHLSVRWNTLAGRTTLYKHRLIYYIMRLTRYDMVRQFLFTSASSKNDGAFEKLSGSDVSETKKGIKDDADFKGVI